MFNIVAAVMKLVYMQHSKCCGSNPMSVRVRPAAQKNSNANYVQLSILKLYLYRNASNGSIRLARRAGTTPVKNPTKTEKITIDKTNHAGL